MGCRNLLHCLALAAWFSSGVGAATLYVNPAHPQATDSGSGSASAPYKSLTYAVRQVSPGDVMLIAGGLYRESVDLRNAVKLREAGTKPTRIEAAPGGQVVIKGSDVVTDWEPLADGVFIRRDWPANSQQVFVDGAALKQIGGTVLDGFPERPGHPMAKLHTSNGGIWPGRIPGGLNEMTDNSFFYDTKAQSLYIKLPFRSLHGHLIEASVRPYLLMSQGVNNLIVRNLRFEHANTTAVSQSGAIALVGDNLVLDRIEVMNVDGNGLDITGNGNKVTNSRANYCGQVGMKVRGKNAKVIDNETSYNNTRGFNKWWEAGGAKFVGAGGLQDSEVSGHRAYFNKGDGIWFDWENKNNKIHDNISAYNLGMGIHYEASQAAEIYNNRVFANSQRGIYLPNSSATLVAYNMVVNNGMEGIAIVNERQDASRSKPTLLPKGNRIIGNVVAWNGKASIVLPSELLDNASDANLFLDTQQPSFSMGWGSRERPIVRGLTAWGTMSGQDKASWYQALPIPSQLAADLQAKKPDPDWSWLRALVANYRIPSDRLSALSPQIAGATPGPRQ